MKNRILRVLLYTLFFLSGFSAINAQDFSNRGKDFWLGYGYHQAMSDPANVQNMVLYFTSGQTASVKVEIPALGWIRTYKVMANSIVESAPLPKGGSQDARLLSEGVFNTGIHITSDTPIVAYAHIYSANTSAASLLFPVNTLGNDYYSLNFTQASSNKKAHSWAFVVATEDSTMVEVTPSVNSLTYSAGQAFYVTLNKGQIYNLFGSITGSNGADLTGTRIRSVNTGTFTRKKIAVFSGSGHTSISCDNRGMSGDVLFQQSPPRSAWGRKYLTVPTAKLTNNYFRILVSNPSTIVTIDGQKASNLINGLYYEITANTPKSIVSDKPVMVAQYITTTNACDNSFYNNGDPEMIYLSPVEQTIEQVTLNSTNHFNITSHYINVVIKSSFVNRFQLDGINPVSSFKTHPYDPAYSYASFAVAGGPHTLIADSGFNAIAYGYGFNESYGYNAGTNIRNLSEILALQNPYAEVNEPITCKNTPFQFSVYLPYKTPSIVWDFGNNAHLFPANTVIKNNVEPDSTITRYGQKLYLYKLQSFYQFNETGTYPVKIITKSPSEDGSYMEQEINYDIQVTALPIANFSFSGSGCVKDTALFYDSSTGGDRALVKWQWQFNDGTIDENQNPKKSFTDPGTNPVKLTAINDIGCFADTTHPVTQAPLPFAKFGFPGSNCGDSNITFADSSSIIEGKIDKWNWNFGNGDTLTNTTNQAVTKTLSPGTYDVTLQTESNIGCKSLAFTKQLTIEASPKVSFSSLPGMCLNDKARMVTEARETTGIAGTFSFSGKGISPLGLFDPAKAGAGQFAIGYVYTSIAGCKDSSTQTITVSENPIIKLKPELVVYKGETVTLEPSVSNDGYKYNWTPDTYLDNATSKSVRSTPQESISYTLTATGNAGCTAEGSVLISLLKEPNMLTVTNPYAEVKAPVTCKNNPFQFSLYLPYKPTSLAWDFQNNPNLSPAKKVTRNNIQPDSTMTRDGQKVYLYKLPIVYQFKETGTYPVKIIASKPLADGSNEEHEINYDVEVTAPPVANFTFRSTGCVKDTAVFYDASIANDKAVVKWQWQFNDGTSDEHKNPRKSFDKAGTYPVKLTAVNDIGCFADTTIQVVQAPLPLAKFGFSGSNCAIGTTTFADSSTISEGKIAQWNWNFGDGDTLSNTTSAAFTKALSPGTYHVTLQTESNIGCKSIVFTKPLIIDASPKVSFSKLAGVCLNDKARMVTEARETTGIPGTFSFSGKGISATGLFDPAKAGAGQFAIGYVYTSIAGCKDSCTQTITVSENPIIKLKSEVVVYKGESVTLEPSLSLNASKYNWAPYTYLDDTSSKSARSTPKESLSYKLTATGNAGCTAQGSVFIKLLKGPNMLTLTNPYAQVNAPVTCKNNPFQFSLYLPYKPTSLVWDFQNNPNLSPAHKVSRNNILPDSTVTTDGQKIYLYKLPIVYQFKETGTYPVKIIANKRSADGSNEEHEINYDVEVIAPPVAKFTFSSTGCVKDTAVFYDASSGNDRAVVKWQWQFNDGTRDEHKNPRKSFAEPGTYPVKLTAINDIGCFASTTVPFTQTARPFAKFGFSGSSCANSAITFIDSSATGFGNIAKWNWNLGNGDTITKTSAQQFKKTYPAGTFNVSLQTESKSGCKSSTENKWITLQAAPKVVFTVMPGVCISDKERAIKEASETTGIAGSFSFSGKGVSPSGTFNPSIAGAGTTTLQYLYTSRNGCTDSARQTITVSQNPVVEPNTRLVVLEGQSVLLGRQNLNSNEKYSWSPGKYLDNPRVHNPYSTPKEDITYRETVTSAEGCKAFRDVTISLVKAPIIPNAFSPNGDGINDVWNISSLNLNPACTVEVFNRYGNPVFISYGYQKPWDGTYKGNTLPVGVYYYIINLKTITKVYSGSLTLLK